MELDEEEMFDDLADEEAEGAAEAFDEFDEFDEFESDEFDEADELEAADGFDEGDEGDEFDEFESDGFDEFESDEEGDDFDTVVARALAAEDTDEFFRRIVRGIRRAAPAIGRVARAAAPILRAIPHPYAQIGGQVAGMLGRLRADGADEEEALDAMAEAAVRNPRAMPVVAGLAVRSVMRGSAARRVPLPVRAQMVRQVRAAAQNLQRRQGRTAARAVSRAARSVRRTAAVRQTPPAARPRVLARTIRRVAGSPAMARRLARPLPRGRAAVRRAGMPGGRIRPAVMRAGGMGGLRRARTIVLRGPTRIVIGR